MCVGGGRDSTSTKGAAIAAQPLLGKEAPDEGTPIPEYKQLQAGKDQREASGCGGTIATSCSDKPSVGSAPPRLQGSLNGVLGRGAAQAVIRTPSQPMQRTDDQHNLAVHIESSHNLAIQESVQGMSSPIRNQGVAGAVWCTQQSSRTPPKGMDSVTLLSVTVVLSLNLVLLSKKKYKQVHFDQI